MIKRIHRIPLYQSYSFYFAFIIQSKLSFNLIIWWVLFPQNWLFMLKYFRTSEHLYYDFLKQSWNKLIAQIFLMRRLKGFRESFSGFFFWSSVSIVRKVAHIRQALPAHGYNRFGYKHIKHRIMNLECMIQDAG